MLGKHRKLDDAEEWMHIRSPSSQKSAKCAEEARTSVLAFFDAPATEYTVIFTSNATGAMRLVGEAFPFAEGGTYVLGMDSHNSINGIRQFALAKGARVAYITPTSMGGVDETEAKVPTFFCFRRVKTHPASAECPSDQQSPTAAHSSAMFVCINGVVQRDEQQEPLVLDRIRFQPRILYTPRRCCSRAFLKSITSQHTR